MIDEARQYKKMVQNSNDMAFAVHGRKDYVGDLYANTIEYFFSIFKHGMKGVCQHCKSNHLNDICASSIFTTTLKKLQTQSGLEAVLSGAMGKRLTYRI
jgi:hypothetical protein